MCCANRRAQSNGCCLWGDRESHSFSECYYCLLSLGVSRSAGLQWGGDVLTSNKTVCLGAQVEAETHWCQSLICLGLWTLVACGTHSLAYRERSGLFIRFHNVTFLSYFLPLSTACALFKTTATIDYLLRLII